ncbi:MAG TPA: hypothetical protein VMV18_02865 [bacterium]|nr:hypothetical protein [bacterium]
MSLFENILKAVKKDEPGVAPEGLALPGSSDATFAPGAHDHLLLYLGLKRKADDREAALAHVEAAVRACAAQSPSPVPLLRDLDQALDLRDAVNIVDDVVERVESLALDDWENVYDAISAVALSTDRPQTLKVAIALLAPFQEPETVNFFAVLARHPEFSLYACTALANDPSPAARAELVALLDTATGWAKVDVIERLLRVEELDLAEALVTKGMENVEPLGHVVALGLAERCGLAEALDSRDTTRDTLVGACRILAQLAEDSASGARGGLDDYSARDRAVSAFVSRLEGGPADLEMIEAAAAVRRWSARMKPSKARRPESGARAKAGKRGKPARAPRSLTAAQIAEETAAYLDRPDVVGVVVSEVLAKQMLRRHRAARLAARAGISDALSPLLEVLTRHPDDDAVAAAAVALASGSELARLRDRLATRIAPEKRTGAPEKMHALDANAKHTWQYLTLIEALPRLPDEPSRALLRTATRDRDPAVRRAAFRALRALPSLEKQDREALSRAADDPAPEIAEEAAGDPGKH